jgi:nitrogen-specific signal transduction histidine kinase
MKHIHMDLTELSKRNEKLQDAAAQLTELMPGTSLVPLTSLVIRSAKRIDRIFPNLLASNTEARFNAIMEKLEEEMDEVLYSLDRLSQMNQSQSVRYINDFVKYGYDLLSVYSFACDKIIERRVKDEI